MNNIKSKQVIQANQLTQNKMEFVQNHSMFEKIEYDKFNEVDLKILKTIFSAIDSNDSLFEEFYIITYQDLDLAGVDKRDRYNKITSSLTKLANFYVILENKERKQHIGLIKNNFIFEKNTNKFICSVYDDLKPYLLDLKEKYSSYNLMELQKLKNLHIIKLFEYLNSFKKQQYIKKKNEDLVQILGLSESYLQWSNLNKFLQKSKKEILSNTKLYFDFKPVKEGRKTVAVDFIIKSKDDTNKISEIDFSKLYGEIYKENDKLFILKNVEYSKEEKAFKGIVLDPLTNLQISTVWKADKERVYNHLKQLIKSYKQSIGV